MTVKFLEFQFLLNVYDPTFIATRVKNYKVLYDPKDDRGIITKFIILAVGKVPK